MGNKIFNVAYANETKNIQPAIDSGDPNLGPGTLIMDEEAGEVSFVGDGRIWHKPPVYGIPEPYFKKDFYGSGNNVLNLSNVVKNGFVTFSYRNAGTQSEPHSLKIGNNNLLYLNKDISSSQAQFVANNSVNTIDLNKIGERKSDETQFDITYNQDSELINNLNFLCKDMFDYYPAEIELTFFRVPDITTTFTENSPMPVSMLDPVTNNLGWVQAAGMLVSAVPETNLIFSDVDLEKGFITYKITGPLEEITFRYLMDVDPTLLIVDGETTEDGGFYMLGNNYLFLGLMVNDRNIPTVSKLKPYSSFKNYTFGYNKKIPLPEGNSLILFDDYRWYMNGYYTKDITPLLQELDKS